MKTKKIILFGAQGMLGTEIFKQSLNKNDVEVIPLARFHANFQEPDNLEKILEKFSKEIEISAVVNAVAFTAVDKCEEPKFQKISSQVNAIAPGILAKKCEELKIPFYHFSTDYVFDGKNNQIFKENSPTNPGNAYGKTKEAGEKEVLKFSKSKILRTAWLAGENGVNFVHKMVHLSKNSKNISIIKNEYGNPTFTFDVANALFELILHPKQYPEKIYHFVSEGSASRRELLEEIQDFLDLKTNITDVNADFFNLPAKRPNSSILLNTKFKKFPHWKDSLHIFLKKEKEKLDKKREIEEKKEQAKKIYKEKQAKERAKKEEK